MAFDDFSDNVFDAIKTYLTAQWNNACAIQWPNEDYQAGDDQPFIAVSLHGTLYGQQSIGANVQADNRWDREGVLWLYVTVSRNTGYTKAGGAALVLANIFRGTRLLSGGLEFMDSIIGPGGFNEEDGAWFIVPVSIEWRYIDAS